MDVPHTVSSFSMGAAGAVVQPQQILSIQESGDFWGEWAPASAAKTAKQTSPAPALAADVAAFEAEREKLLLQLVFAARDLAENNLIPTIEIGNIDGVSIRTAGCRECMHSPILGNLWHGEYCKTGRVLKVISRLVSLPERR